MPKKEGDRGNMSGQDQVMKVKPTAGRIVHYRVREGDANSFYFNDVQAGDLLPAIIVRVHEGSVNLQVFSDGGGVVWLAHVSEGAEPGMWSWPKR